MLKPKDARAEQCKNEYVMPTINRKQARPPWIPKREPFKMAVDNSKFYNSAAWRKLSRAFKNENPLCKNFDECGGVTHTSDHIIPITEGGAKFDWDNLQPLCVSCNASKTAKQGKK